MRLPRIPFLKFHWAKLLSLVFFVGLSISYIQTFAVFTPGQTLDPNCAPGTGGCYVSGGGGGSPSGANTQVQFNDAGVFAGNSAFTFNKTTSTLRVNDIFFEGREIYAASGESLVLFSNDGVGSELRLLNDGGISMEAMNSADIVMEGSNGNHLYLNGDGSTQLTANNDQQVALIGNHDNYVSVDGDGGISIGAQDGTSILIDNFSNSNYLHLNSDGSTELTADSNGDLLLGANNETAYLRLMSNGSARLQTDGDNLTLINNNQSNQAVFYGTGGVLIQASNNDGLTIEGSGTTTFINGGNNNGLVLAEDGGVTLTATNGSSLLINNESNNNSLSLGDDGTVGLYADDGGDLTIKNNTNGNELLLQENGYTSLSAQNGEQLNISNDTWGNYLRLYPDGVSELSGNELHLYSDNNILFSPGSDSVGIIGSNKYLNFNSNDGDSGYGIRDNSGIMEFKNDGGSWMSFGGAGGGIYYVGTSYIGQTSGFAGDGTDGLVNGGDSIFIGNNAGYGTNDAEFSNLIGDHAGDGSNVVINSNFIGLHAGSTANDVAYVNFIGDHAGYGTEAVLHANLIGDHAGYNVGDVAYVNFIGDHAGDGVSDAFYTNFIGNQAGSNADAVSHSNFIGDHAGYNTSGSTYSNFIGDHAGYDSNAAYSNLLGFNVGRANQGYNNIIIGTNISLADGISNAINIGGVLFGSGTYHTLTGSPSTDPVSGGRIGIGVAEPNSILHIQDLNTTPTITIQGPGDSEGQIAFVDGSMNQSLLISGLGGSDPGIYTSKNLRFQADQYITISSGDGIIALSGVNNYLNFNSDNAGETGYGFRDNGGVMQFKNDGGDWLTFLGTTVLTDDPISLTTNDGENITIGADGGLTLSSFAGDAILRSTGSNVIVSSEGGQLELNGDSAMTISSSGGIAMTGDTIDMTGFNSGVDDFFRIITPSGNTCTFSTTTGLFSCASDRRLKHDIAPIGTSDAMTKLNALNPVVYLYNWQSQNDPLVSGFIAQELEQTFPELVMTDSKTGYKSITYVPLIPYTVRAVQDLDVRIKGFSSLDVNLTGSMGFLIKQFLGDVGNTISDLYAKTIHTDQVCIKNTCVNEEELIKIINNANSNQNIGQPSVFTSDNEEPNPNTDEEIINNTSPSDDVPTASDPIPEQSEPVTP